MEKRKTIVIKIGSSVLVTRRRKVDRFQTHQIARQVAELIDCNMQVVLVVSGAVSVGLKFVNKGDSQLIKQCAAGVGWPFVFRSFDSVFNSYNLKTAQILLTKSMLSENNFKVRLSKVLQFYLKENIVPIVNENDVCHLNCFGGNDFLAFEIASLISADKLLILSSYKSCFGYGGGKSKERVIKQAGKIGLEAHILDGKKKDIILNQL